jgi:phosphoribosyl 1,2-cyclic phosphate phosphodiesterase
MRGTPYSRSGPSMFIKDVNVLFDTPEEVASQLNRERINVIDYIFYTHWHPDHTFGMRIVERMYKFWLDMCVKEKPPSNKVKICATDKVMEDLKSMGYRGGSFFEYYEKYDLIEATNLTEGKPFKIRGLAITPFEVETTYDVSTVFLVQQKGKKVIYAPCDVKPFPEKPELENADLLTIGSFYLDGPLKEGIIIPPNNPLRLELFSIGELQELSKKLKAKKTLVTHIEEEWGKGFDEYKQLEKECNLRFAYDGMRIGI